MRTKSSNNKTIQLHQNYTKRNRSQLWISDFNIVSLFLLFQTYAKQHKVSVEIEYDDIRLVKLLFSSQFI